MVGRLRADQELPPGCEGLIYEAFPRGELGLQYVGSFIRQGVDTTPRDAFSKVLYRARKATTGELARVCQRHPLMGSWDVRVLERIVDLRHPAEVADAKQRWLLDLQPTLNTRQSVAEGC